MEKRCYKCKLQKSIEEFHKSKSNPRGYRGECKKCSRIITAEYFRKHPEAAKKGDLKYRLTHKFGLTLNEYNNIGDLYNWRCFICKIPQSECSTNLAVDHDHSDGRIRGLLCRRCNHGLGFFKDDVSLLNEAVKYLQYENAGYKGLYGGLTMQDIHTKKKLKNSPLHKLNCSSYIAGLDSICFSLFDHTLFFIFYLVSISYLMIVCQ